MYVNLKYLRGTKYDWKIIVDTSFEILAYVAQVEPEIYEHKLSP